MVDPPRDALVLPYRETLRGSVLLIAAVFLAALGGAAGGLAATMDTRLPPAERLVVAVLMLLVVLVLVFVAVVFTRLRVEVDAVRVSWSFGPFRKSVPLEQVAAVRVEPYRWLRFGGWGIRYGVLGGGGSAYTVPFSLRGVTLELRDRQRYYLSSRDPDRLAAAIDAARVPGRTGL